MFYVKGDDGKAKIVEESNYYPFGLKHKGYNNVVDPIAEKYKYGYNGKEEQEELGLGWIDYQARNYDPALGCWMNIDLMAEDPKQIMYSPYSYVLNNPLFYNDPTGMVANPIYDVGGNFLGTDDKGLQGKAIVMDEANFTQGMSHNDAISNNLGVEGLENTKAASNLVSHYKGLKDRPDYDGFVTLTEGVEWAKANPGALDNPTPDNMLYIDASKLDYGDLNTSKFQNENESTPVNLFTVNNLLNAGLNTDLRATVYALGRVNMKLTDRTWGKVQIVNDFNQSSDRVTDYDWNKGGTGMRSRAINIERARTGLNDSHGFRAYYYGRGTIKGSPSRGIITSSIN
ncbi:hypothetical protein UJ101_01910 [Flavobacteriaceae bacterium UJ101]|nr:hypothetical protein UJ101_01910 [Flavobacteriaceae bacterium UJ101]